MWDWNGNGKIDPTDVGIYIVVENDCKNEEKNKRSGGGCLTTCLTGIFLIVCIAILIV